MQHASAPVPLCWTEARSCRRRGLSRPRVWQSTAHRDTGDVDGSALCQVIRCVPDRCECVSTRMLLVPDDHNQVRSIREWVLFSSATSRRACGCLRMQHVVMSSDVADHLVWSCVRRCRALCRAIGLSRSACASQSELFHITSDPLDLTSSASHRRLLTLPQCRLHLMAAELSYSCRFRSLLDVLSSSPAIPALIVGRHLLLLCFCPWRVDFLRDRMGHSSQCRRSNSSLTTTQRYQRRSW